MIEGHRDPGGAVGVAHDIGQGLAHEREDGVGDAGVLRARPGLGQGDGEPGAPGGVQAEE